MKKNDIIIILTAAALLVPLLFFPISLDLSIFASAGKVIAEGGKIYVDYVDVKPPLIYYIFAGIYELFGWDTIFLRLFDYFWQLASVISLLIVMKKLLNNRAPAYISIIIYVLAYIGMNYENTTQCEGLTALPLVWLIYLLAKKGNSPAAQITAGVLAGFITALKYSFGIIILPILIFDIVYSDNILEFLKKAGRQAAGFLAAMLLFSLPLFDSEVREGFFNLIKYLSFYSNNPPLSIGYLGISIKVIGGYLGARYSLLLTIAFFFGLYFLLSKNKIAFNKKNEFLLISLFLIFSLLASVFFEKKYYFYHHLRYYLPMVMITGIGLYEIGKLVFKGTNGFGLRTFILSMFLIFALVFGPFVRYGYYALTPYYYFADREKYLTVFDKPSSMEDITVEQRKIASVLKKNLKKNDKLLIMSIESNPLYQMTDAGRISKYALSSMYFGKGAPAEWEAGIFNEIKSADWIVIQSRLRQFIFNGHNKTVMESLKERKEMYDYFIKNFTAVDTSTSLYVFKRRGKKLINHSH